MTAIGRHVVVFLAACLIPGLFLPALLAQDVDGGPSASEENATRVRVVRVEGSHYDAGFQLGTQLKANLVSEVRAMKEQDDWAKVRGETELFLQYSKEHVPEYVAEVQGVPTPPGWSSWICFRRSARRSATRTTAPREAART